MGLALASFAFYEKQGRGLPGADMAMLQAEAPWCLWVYCPDKHHLKHALKRQGQPKLKGQVSPDLPVPVGRGGEDQESSQAGRELGVCSNTGEQGHGYLRTRVSCVRARARVCV